MELIQSRCDGANRLDGVGFNKIHAPIVRSLLQREKWTTGQLKLAQQILQHYRKQLEDYYGIDFKKDVDPSLDNVYEEDKTATSAQKLAYLYPSAEKGIFKFPYDKNLVHELKTTFYHRRFSPETKMWTVWGKIEELEKFARKHGFKITYRHEPRGIITVEDGVMVLKSDYDPVLVEELKRIGATWSKRRKAWLLSFSPSALKDLTTLLDMGFEIENPEEIDAQVQRFETFLKLSQQTNSSFDVKLKGGSLLPYQKAGVEYIVKRRRALLADTMGLGKTIQSIAAVEYLQTYPVLVVCPASLKLNWKKEIERWSWHSEVYVVNSSELLRESKKRKVSVDEILIENAEGKNWVIINYDILKKFQDSLLSLPFKAIILDESHYIKNPKAQRTKAAIKIIDSLRDNLDLVVLLTGTPMTAKPLDLIPQLKALGVFHQVARTVTEFKERYTIVDYTPWGPIYKGAKNIKDLNERLRAACMIRREKEDVLKELPPKVRSFVPVEIPAEFREEYERAVGDIVHYMIEKAIEAGATEEEIKEVAQKTLRGEILVRISKAQEILGKAKANIAKQWIEDFFESNPDEKLVVFAIHREIQEELYKFAKEKGLNPARIFGDDSTEARQMNVDKFQNDPSCKIIIASLKAGGVGLTLTAASYVLFVEVDWVPANLDQAEDRLHRIGQENTVFIYYLIVPDSLDERIISVIEEKRRVTQEGISYISESEMLKELSKYFKEIKKSNRKSKRRRNRAKEN